MLKSRKLGNETNRRKGGAGAPRAIQQIGDRKAPIPPEYQKLVESYTRSLSKQADKPADKAATDKAKKNPAAKKSLLAALAGPSSRRGSLIHPVKSRPLPPLPPFPPQAPRALVPPR